MNQPIKNKISAFLSRFPDTKKPQLISAYLDSFQKHENNCRLALAHKDAALLQSAAHDIKSLMRMLEMEETGALAEEIELNAGSDKSYMQTADLITRVSDITEILKTLKSAP